MKFLTHSSADDVIFKVYDIRTQESERVHKRMVLGGETIDNCDEVKPQAYNAPSRKDSLTGLDWDTSSDEEKDKKQKLNWMEEDSVDDEEEMQKKEEELDRKAEEEREAKIEPLTIRKVFRELHLQYFSKGNKILKQQGTVRESHPTSFSFEERPWETLVHHAILDKFVRYLSCIPGVTDG